MTHQEQIDAQADRIKALHNRISQLTKALEKLTEANERGAAALSRLISENEELRERLNFNEGE